jgi:hypothetical protein
MPPPVAAEGHKKRALPAASCGLPGGSRKRGAARKRGFRVHAQEGAVSWGTTAPRRALRLRRGALSPDSSRAEALLVCSRTRVHQIQQSLSPAPRGRAAEAG